MTHLVYKYLKQTPQDFIVEEVISEDFLKKEGKYTVYKLEKTNLSTLQVIRFLSKNKILPTKRKLCNCIYQKVNFNLSIETNYKFYRKR